MHADEIETDPDLVRRLLAAQFPQWADLPIERLASGGTSNAIYRIGDRLSARLPLREPGTHQIEKERAWLPRLAPHLPLTLPAPLAQGEPGEGYPLIWGVYPWLDGVNAEFDQLDEPVAAAETLAAFLIALRDIDTAGGPEPSARNFGRGVPLATRDEATRRAIAASEGLVDIEAVTAAWDADLHAPLWDGPPLWIHGDLQPGNLLATDGQLNAVIDWGGLAIGDPATDLLPAWNLFHGESRQAFRATLEVDDASWARGRGWALSMAMIGLPYYIGTNPAFIAMARQMIDAVLEDHDR